MFIIKIAFILVLGKVACHNCYAIIVLIESHLKTRHTAKGFLA